MGWKTLRFEQRMTSRGQQVVECWLDEDGQPLQLLEVVPVADQMQTPSVIVDCRNRYEHLTWKH
ncbi:MAG: hypothetical protein IJL05_03465 [Alphaproteobacteria bacterium]|nr:hypothetical protein [Alphaproteobacteria bacterium]